MLYITRAQLNCSSYNLCMYKKVEKRKQQEANYRKTTLKKQELPLICVLGSMFCLDTDLLLNKLMMG